MPNVYDFNGPLDFKSVDVQEDTYCRATKDTCRWILQLPAFKQWVAATSGPRTLWLHGLPGGGKTFATSIIVNYLLRNPDNIIPTNYGRSSMAYVYCNHHTSQLEPLDLIRNIVHQLSVTQLGRGFHLATPSSDILKYLRQNCFGSVPGLQYYNSRYPLSLEECRMFLSSTRQGSICIYIVIDALDECQDMGQIINILQGLYDLNSNIRFLITSRTQGNFQDRLGDPCYIEVRATDEDILLYITQSIKNSIKLEQAVARDPTLESEITNYMLNNARGMFLLPRLWLDRLGRQNTPRQIRSILKSSNFGLPVQLSDLYTAAMQRIQRQEIEDRNLANDALAWIIRAKEPLTLGALTHALGTLEEDTHFHEDGVPDAKNVFSACAGLVTTHKEDQTVCLAHPTLSEFFNRNAGLISHNLQLLPQTCFTYMSGVLCHLVMPTSGDAYESFVQTSLKTYPFLSHACKYWSVHARERVTAEFLCQRPSEVRLSISIAGLVGCIPDCRSKKLPPPNLSPLHAAVLFNLPKVVTLLLENTFGNFLHAKDTNGNTPLIWAAYNGRAEILRQFLKSAPPDHDLNVTGVKGKGAVYYAAEEGNDNVLEVLSRQHERIDTSLAEASEGLTPLIIAAKNGHVRSVKILLEEFKAYVDLTDAKGATPLLHAVHAGHTEVIQTLLVHGAEVTCATPEGETPLEAALFKSHETVITILLEHLNQLKRSAHVQAVVKNAIFKVSRNGNIYALRNILGLRSRLGPMAGAGKLGLSIPFLWSYKELIDESGRNPLSHAAEAGHLDVAQEFLNQSCDVFLRDNKHWTPFHFATFNGNTEVLQLLFTKGDYLYWTGPNDPEDLSDGYDTDPESTEYSWTRERSEEVVKMLSILVASPAFLRPGKTPALSRNPTGIMPCVQLLIEKFRRSRRLNLMLQRVLNHAVLQAIICHPEHKHELDETDPSCQYNTEHLQACPMIRSVRLPRDNTGGSAAEDATDLHVELIGLHGAHTRMVLKCGPTDTVDSDSEKRRVELTYIKTWQGHTTEM